MKRSAWLRVAFGLTLSAVFLYFSVRGVDIEAVKAALRGAEYLYLVPAMAVVTLSFFLRALRWLIILRPVKRVSVRNAFSATMIGFMANNVLPMRAGEVVRAVVIGRQESISRSSALATIVVERVFDIVALLVTLLAGAIGHELPREIANAVWVVALTTIFAFVALAVLARTESPAETFVRRFPGGGSKWGGRIARQLDYFRVGLGVFRNSVATAVTLVLSALVWGCFVAAYHFTLVAFDLHLGLRPPILLLGVVSIGVMLPSAPGYIGTMQWFFQKAVAPFGVGGSLALSASFFFWFAQYLPVTVIGLVYFVMENVNLKSVLAEGRATRARQGARPEGVEP